jgi:DNA-binding response OmpR family regulator
MRELVARLHALLRRVEKTKHMLAADRQPSPGAFRRDALIIEPENHRVLLEGKEIDLTPIEFALLSLLARNPGRAFNRAYLVETVWDESYIPGDRSVDNAVLRLRKKIQPYGDEIEAVWGVGYRWRSQK